MKLYPFKGKLRIQLVQKQCIETVVLIALMFIMQKLKTLNIVFFAICYYTTLRDKYVYCSYTILDKIISESEHLESLIDERTNLKRKIFFKVNASYRIYSPGCARIDEFIYETLIKLKVDSESLAKSSMSKQLIDTIDLMRDVCDDDCKKEEVCKHFNKALFVNHKAEFCQLFVDHIYQKRLHLRRRYRTYINLRNDMVDTFFNYKSSFESHKEPYLHVKNILPWDITEKIMAAFYQLRVACDETDCFTQFMSDTRYYDVIGSKNSKELNILNMAIVYSVLNLLILIGSCIIEVSHHKILLVQMTELGKILILSGHTDQSRRKGILNPENCRRLFDCYLAYSAYIHEFVKFPELNDHFHSPPFFYEYDVRCDIYTMSDGSEFYRPSKNWSEVGRVYFTRYEAQCNTFMLKHAIFHDRGERLKRTLNLLFMTAFSEPESPFGSSCMLLLFNAIVKSK